MSRVYENFKVLKEKSQKKESLKNDLYSDETHLHQAFHKIFTSVSLFFQNSLFVKIKRRFLLESNATAITIANIRIR